jgi:tRNA threonylcarbamoyladenosine biosynthesis protein TsaB
MVITLAIDTCEVRGSVAVRHGGDLLARQEHTNNADYSAWLLPAVDGVLSDAKVKMKQIDLLAVATGPGSFTGLRVGLTTVKAWSEVYGKPIVGVSRLEAMARSDGATSQGFVVACYNAQRGQLFAGLYKRRSNLMQRVGDELVVSPVEFLEYIHERAGGSTVAWVSLDPEMVTDLERFKRRVDQGDTIRACSPELANMIGFLGEERAARGDFSDPLALDANYVRRSDAEIFWKGPGSNVR